jgi:hypothetical protein
LFWCWNNTYTKWCIVLEYELASVINVHSRQGMQYISDPWFWECQVEVILTDGCNFVIGVARLDPQCPRQSNWRGYNTRVEYWRSDCLGRNTTLGCCPSLSGSDKFTCSFYQQRRALGLNRILNQGG